MIARIAKKEMTEMFRDGRFRLASAIVAVLLLASLAAVMMRVPRRREVLLFSGTALALILGAAATAGFGLRYLVPAVPLLAIGGGLAVWELATRRQWAGQRRVAAHGQARLLSRRT